MTTWPAYGAFYGNPLFPDGFRGNVFDRSYFPYRQVFQGDSMPFQFDLDGAYLPNATLTIYVRQSKGGTDLIPPRTIQSRWSNTLWFDELTPDETSPLAAGEYRLIGVIEGTTPETGEAVRREKTIRFQVREPWVTAA